LTTNPTNVLIGSNSAARRPKSYSDVTLPPLIGVCIASEPPRSGWTSESCVNDTQRLGRQQNGRKESATNEHPGL